VPDVRAAAEFYAKKLGFNVAFTFGDPPTFAGVNLGNVQIFLEKGTPAPEGCAVYFVVGDADELHAFHEAAGVEILEPPSDKEYGIRDYQVRDGNGYRLGFGHHIFSTGEQIPVERVDVPVRLEKRLAALLADLAVHKRMSVSSVLEETLLHTFEDVGPHSKRDLRKIQELRAKHGIDYDSHGSYRFVER